MLRQIYIQVCRPSGLGAIVTERSGPAGCCRLSEDAHTEVMNDLPNGQRPCLGLSLLVLGIDVDGLCHTAKGIAHGLESADGLTDLRENEFSRIAGETFHDSGH